MLRANTLRAAGDEPGRHVKEGSGQVSNQGERAVPRDRRPSLGAPQNQGASKIAGDDHQEPALTRHRRTQVCVVRVVYTKRLLVDVSRAQVRTPPPVPCLGAALNEATNCQGP